MSDGGGDAGGDFGGDFGSDHHSHSHDHGGGYDPFLHQDDNSDSYVSPTDTGSSNNKKRTEQAIEKEAEKSSLLPKSTAGRIVLAIVAGVAVLGAAVAYLRNREEKQAEQDATIPGR